MKRKIKKNCGLMSIFLLNSYGKHVQDLTISLLEPQDWKLNQPIVTRFSSKYKTDRWRQLDSNTWANTLGRSIP